MRGNCRNGILLNFRIIGAVYPRFLSEIAGFQGELFNNLLKKKGQLFSNGILHLQQHEGIYYNTCHWGNGESSFSVFCFVLFLKNFNSMPTSELWIDLLMFPFFSLILTFCSDYIYHYVPSS